MLHRCWRPVALAALCAAALSPSAHAARVDGKFGAATLPFLPNLGQHDKDVGFVVMGADTTATFRSRGIDISLAHPATSAHPRTVRGLDLRSLRAQAKHPSRIDPRLTAASTLSIEFVGAREGAGPQGTALASATVSSFHGPTDGWKTGQPTYSRIAYPQLWPGIDMEWTGARNALKYQFSLAPGIGPSAIAMAVSGAEQVSVSDAGDLVIRTAVRTLTDPRPVAFQTIDGRATSVPTRWTVEPTSNGTYRVGVVAEAYDRSRALVIDPAVLVYATFLGSSIDDRGLGVAVDGSDNVYICGEAPNVTSYDAYVAKYDSSGALVYFAYLGGESYDACYDIAVNSTGEAYMTGATSSDQATFAEFLGPDLTYNGGNADAFVCKVNAAGSALLYCGYLGGAKTDFAEGIRVDASDAVYVTGITGSDQTTFPAVAGPDTTFNGKYDTFVAKLVPTPSAVIVTDNYEYAGYIGGKSIDIGLVHGFLTNGHIAIDPTGNAYVSGMTKSKGDSFPDGDGFGALTTWDSTRAGSYDAYVAKVNPSGTGLVYAGYIGGKKPDFGFGMGVDGAGNAYLTGDTKSDETTFPVVVGPDLTYNGKVDAFVAKVNAAGTALVYCGYLGGDAYDQGHGLAVNAAGNAYVAGHAVSSQTTLAVVGGPDLTFNGMGKNIGDAVIAKVKLDPSDPTPANNYDYLGYVGGSGEDHAFWVALDSTGAALVVGDTNSSETTFPDGDGFGALPGHDTTAEGGFDAFLVKVTE